MARRGRGRRAAAWLMAWAALGCTDRADDEPARREADEPSAPLRLSAAPRALCAGAANRESDGEHRRRPHGEPGGGRSNGSGGPPPAYDGAGGGTAGAAGDPGYGGFGEAGGYGGFGSAGGAGGFGGSGGFGRAGGSGGQPAPPDAGPTDAGPTDAGPGEACAASDAGCPPPPDAGPAARCEAADGGDAGCRPPADGGGATGSMSQPLCEDIDLENPRVLYLPSDDSNSMASPVIVRGRIRAGVRTFDPWEIRVHEFLNYYRFDFEPPDPGLLAVHAQLGSCVLTGDVAFQLAVQAPPPPPKRRPLNVVFVLDTSGSMSGRPIELERATVRALASALSPGDVVSVVTWSTDQRPLLAGYTVERPDDPVLLAVADGLRASGGTDLHAGLLAGYELAERFHEPGRISRVILVSDGRANVGVTDEALIGAKAEDRDGEGIYLIGVGVGEGVDDTLMDTVTDAGRGAYVYLDTPEEARHIFVDRFAESVLVGARGVRIELTLPPYFNIQKFYGEEYSPDPTKVRPQHLAPGDSMVLYQILRPCDPALPRADDPLRVRVTWEDPITGTPREVVRETTLGALDIDDGNLTKAAAIVTYAEALKQLRDLSPDQRLRTLREAKATVRRANVSGADPDLREIGDLLDTLIATHAATPR